MTRRRFPERRPQVSWRVKWAVGLGAVWLSMGLAGLWWSEAAGWITLGVVVVGLLGGSLWATARDRRRARLLRTNPRAYLDEVAPDPGQESPWDNR